MIEVTPRLITFNCLSPYYARPEWLNGVQEKYLDPDYRLQRLEHLMKDSWFKVNFIIALQELDANWSDRIRKLCEENNYNLVYSSYFDGHMGVGIAYPINHYQLITSDIFDAPGSARSHIEKMSMILNNSDVLDKLDVKSVNSMKNIVRSFSSAENKTFMNSLVSVLLRAKLKGHDSSVELLVTTYHMPCRFTEPIYMMCQAREMLAHQNELIEFYKSPDFTTRQSMGFSYPTQIVPIIVADCNIGPKEPAYQILTQSKKCLISNRNIDQIIDQIMEAYSKIGVDFLAYSEMRSAFVMATGFEPKFTNVKLADPNNFKSVDFIETIDYILVPSNVKVKSVRLGLVPKNDSQICAYPNAICPSDHLPLSASICIY